MPAFIYFVNNNLVFFILLAVDPVLFQLLSQLKTLFTGLLFRIVLQKRLSLAQCAALVVLACGTAVAQLRRCDGGGGDDGDANSAAWGLMLSIVSAFLSSLAGIYSEKLLKGRVEAPLHWQNVQLYLWGALFNTIAWLLALAYAGQRLATIHPEGRMDGWTWAVIVWNALTGLAISAVLKFADNIARASTRTPPRCSRRPCCASRSLAWRRRRSCSSRWSS